MLVTVRAAPNGCLTVSSMDLINEIAIISYFWTHSFTLLSNEYLIPNNREKALKPLKLTLTWWGSVVRIHSRLPVFCEKREILVVWRFLSLFSIKTRDYAAFNERSY